MTGFAEVRRVRVPEAVTNATQRFLRVMGRTGNEGLVLWCGRAEGNWFHVTELMIPRQKAIKTADGVCAIVDADELHRINHELFASGLRVIAQVHSHPADAYHSAMDDENAIANTVGAISIVVPDFAAREFGLDDAAVYRLGPSGNWRPLSVTEASELIEIAGD